jgi:E3 ubiquitin-protein ligase BOI-like protein
MLSAVKRTMVRRLRVAEAELEHALALNMDLDERLQHTKAEGQAWQHIARSHNGVAAGLCATLDNLMQSPCASAEGDMEDAQSCCFEWKQEQGEGA